MICIDHKTKERFYKKVAHPDSNGCMDWRGATYSYGHGCFMLHKKPKQKNIGAHRFSYMVHVGPIPDEIEVCHKCDRPQCVAPDHLFLGTHADNMRDMALKKRAIGHIGSTNPKAQLCEAQVIDIRYKIDCGIKSELIKSEYNISKSVLSGIKRRITWKHI